MKPTLETKKFTDHPNYNEMMSSFCNSNPHSKICGHLKLKAASKLTDKLAEPCETDNKVQSQLKSNSYERTLVKQRPPLQPLNKRSTDALKIIESSKSFPYLFVNNTEENDWSNKSMGTFETFVKMFNRIPVNVPSADINEQDPASSQHYSIKNPSNSSSYNADDTGFLNIDSSSSLNEGSENNNVVNYYQSVQNALDLESRRLSDQAKLIEDIVKKKCDLSTSSSPTVQLEFKKDPPDWVFSSGEAKSAVVDFVPASNTYDNNNPPDWIFSPPESVARYKSNSKITDESDKDKYSECLFPSRNIFPLNDLELEAELVDDTKDYESQFDGEKNTVLFHNNERALGEEDRPYPKSNHQTFAISKPRKSQLEDREQLLLRREESLRDLRNFVMKNYVSLKNSRVVTEKNKRRSVTNGKNIKNKNNTKEDIDHKRGISHTKVDCSTPSMIHNHSFSPEKTNLQPVSEDLSIKSNKTICLAKNSTKGNIDDNKKSNATKKKSEPTLISKNLKQKEKSNHTVRFDKSSELLKSFVNNQSEKPNCNAFQKGVFVNIRDYPKISNVEGFSIEQLLKANNGIHRFNVSDESYVILRSKELQRMKNVLLDNFKQMIVNSEMKSDSSTCYYPWELTTLGTDSQSQSTGAPIIEGSTNNYGQSLSTCEGITATNSQEADSTTTNSQDFHTIASTCPQDADSSAANSQDVVTIASTRPQYDTFSPTPLQDEQDNSKQNQPSDLSSSTESQIFPGTTQQQPELCFQPSNDNDSNKNKVADNLDCQGEDAFTEGFYFLLPAKGVNAMKCALENSRKIYMGSSITGKFIASINTPNMVAKEKFSYNPLSRNFAYSNDTILRETIENILRNKKNGEVELQQVNFNEGENGVKGTKKEVEIIT